MKQSEKKEVNKNWHKYHVPGGSRIQTLKRNAVFISITNTLKHELAKFIGAYMLKKYGDVKFDKELNDMIDVIYYYVGKLFEEWKLNPSEFITEAVPIEDNSRRVDIVDLRSNTRFEFETNHKIKKKGAVTIYI